MGFPFLTGFYSKDLILECAYSRFIIDANFIYFLGLTSAICTAIYSFRLLYIVFLCTKKINGFRKYYSGLLLNIVECQWQMFVSMFILAIFSIIIGYFSSELILGMGHFFWADSISVLPEHFNFIDIEFIHPIIKNLPVILSLVAMYITWIILYYIDMYKLEHSKLNNFIRKFWSTICIKYFSWAFNAGFFNTIYNNLFINIFFISYLNINKYLDKGLFEYFGPYGLYKFFRKIFIFFNLTSYSLIYITASLIFIGCILVIFIITLNLFINFNTFEGSLVIIIVFLLQLRSFFKN